MSTALFWFTLDLRLQDQPGLAAAMRNHDQVVPLFILDEADPWFFGGASQWWLHHSLASLQQSIAQQSGMLCLRRGNTQECLLDAIKKSGADTVYFSRAYEPWLAACQQQIFEELNARGLTCKRFSGRLLLEPDQILNQQGKPFQVFTPYYKHCLRLLSPPRITPPPKPKWYGKKVQSDQLNEWQLSPSQPNWAAGFDQWQPGEEGASQRLQVVVKQRVVDYAQRRDFPAQDGTSQLSAHLHFGELSPRQVWAAVSHRQQAIPGHAEPFLRQLIWREFSVYLLHHWPHLPTSPFKPAFANFPWQKNATRLDAWQRGLTGYPIVDAGMRQLWHTGWMHNRVRMIAASFLTKHLQIHWSEGAQWFWDTLVDADLANNSAGWQWVAGCGADAVPYFRIFNPVLQGEKFDKDGDYVREWVPELARLPSKFIHQPWTAPAEILQTAKVVLGSDGAHTYPKPIVQHEAARAAALAAYSHIKSANSAAG